MFDVSGYQQCQLESADNVSAVLEALEGHIAFVDFVFASPPDKVPTSLPGDLESLGHRPVSANWVASWPGYGSWNERVLQTRYRWNEDLRELLLRYRSFFSHPTPSNARDSQPKFGPQPGFGSVDVSFRDADGEVLCFTVAHRSVIAIRDDFADQGVVQTVAV